MPQRLANFILLPADVPNEPLQLRRTSMFRTTLPSPFPHFQAPASTPALTTASRSNIKHDNIAPARRTVLSALALSPVIYSRAAFAQDTPNSNPSPTDVAKVVVWFVGAKLGLAAMAYFRNTADYQEFFNDAKSRAKEIDIDIADFPPRPSKSTDGFLALLDYINKGDGARIEDQIFQKFGDYHATLYDVSSKLFLIPLVYDLDPDEARTTLVAGMRKKLNTINMPDRLWQPVADAVMAKKSFDDVRAATIQMNNDVLDYLIAVARGQQQ
jgi:hypothetical protein